MRDDQAGQALGQRALVAHGRARRSPASTATTVSSTIATNGAGTTVVSRGSSTMMATPRPPSGRPAHGTPIRCGTWLVKIRIASALTKPTMTLRGMNRISLATPSRLSTICSRPAEQHRGDQVVDAVLPGDRGDHQGDRAGGGRDHRGTATDNGDGDRHRDRAEQTDPRVDPGDDRERDRLGDQGQRHHESGQHLGAQPPGSRRARRTEVAATGSAAGGRSGRLALRARRACWTSDLPSGGRRDEPGHRCRTSAGETAELYPGRLVGDTGAVTQPATQLRPSSRTARGWASRS